jgi:hypothetical protein
MGECSFSTLFPSLFKHTIYPQATVQQILDDPDHFLIFNRQLLGYLRLEKQTLDSVIREIQVTSSQTDYYIWRWQDSAKFKVHLLYEWLDFGGVPNTDFDIVWKSKLPMKIKVFMWLVRRKRIMTKDLLLKRGWVGDSSCVFCGEHETIHHLFVTCPFINSIWQWISAYNNFYFTGTTLKDIWIMDYAIPMKDKALLELIRGAIFWTIWLERNKLIFTDKSTSSIRNLAMKFISLLSYWCSTNNDGSFLKFQLIIPQNVRGLPELTIGREIREMEMQEVLPEETGSGLERELLLLAN